MASLTLLRNKNSKAAVRKFLKKEKAKIGFDALNQTLPPILEEAFDYLEKFAIYEEGIFRVPGELGEIENLKMQYIKGEEIRMKGII
jgi:hypothetical protein